MAGKNCFPGICGRKNGGSSVFAGFGRHTREHRRAASEKRRQWHSTGKNWTTVRRNWNGLQPVPLHIFLQYGLKIEERQEYEFRQVDLGNVIHQALEQFSRNLKKNRLTWRSLTDQERDQLIDTSVEETIHDYGNTILESSARNQYMTCV